MKRTSLLQIALGVIATVVLSGSAFAQTNGQNHQQGGKQIHQQAGHAAHKGNKIGKRFASLNLTERQKQQIHEIMTRARADRKLHAGNRVTGAVDKEQMKREHQEIRSHIAAVLTPAQREKFAAMKKEHRKGHKGGNAKRGQNTKKNIPPA